MTNPVPEEFDGLTPHLVVPDADAASRFYTAAFGADELQRWHGRPYLVLRAADRR